MRLKRDVAKREVVIRGAGLWKNCSLPDTGSGHKMLIRSSRKGIWQHNIRNVCQLL